MIIISNGSNIVLTISGKQQFSKQNYRLFKYVHFVKYDNGYILVNALTRMKLWISEKEYATVISTNNYDDDIGKFLFENWFFVPETFEDRKFFMQVNETSKLLLKRKDNGINSFVIFTTTKCNARCKYCYELGERRISMNEDTALDVAKFIIKESHGEKVFIKWFGGEPLYNANVIDIICKKLIEGKIEFESKMISNAYLFDNNYIEKAKTLWNLKHIQITLDGTADVYNKIKAYIYASKESPFEIVTNNIENILKNNIAVSIRLNFDLSNCEDIKKLISYLIERYGKYKNCNVYTSIIKDYNFKADVDYETRKKLCNELSEMTEILYKAGLFVPKKILKSELSLFRCMADNDKATTILPDGKLGKCEHYLNDNFWGDIYGGFIDEEVIASFKKMKKMLSKCEGCIWEFECGSLEKCNGLPMLCDDIEYISRTEIINRSLVYEYESIKKIIQ